MQRVAEEAEFFSFSCQRPPQTALGISDDASPSSDLRGKRHLRKDPFVSIDRDGVGGLVRIGCQRGREARPNSNRRLWRTRRRPAAFFFEEAGLDMEAPAPSASRRRLAAAHCAEEVEIITARAPPPSYRGAADTGRGMGRGSAKIALQLLWSRTCSRPALQPRSPAPRSGPS